VIVFDEQLNKWERYLIRVGLGRGLAGKIAIIAEEYDKPEHGKWNNNT